MPEFWETAFEERQMMWGVEPALSAIFARSYFAERGVKDVLIPGVGYGRNARPFLEQGTTDMPFDSHQYDGVFCYGLIYLLDRPGREKLISDCYRQLRHGGHMIFTVIAKQAPMYGRGEKLGEDWYETHPGVQMYFYDADSIERELGSYGLAELVSTEEPAHGASLPFININCNKG